MSTISNASVSTVSQYLTQLDSNSSTSSSKETLTGKPKGMPKDMPPPPQGGQGGPDSQQISQGSKVRNAFESLSEDDSSAVKSYMDQLQESMKDGTYDAASATKNVPEALTNALKEQGVSTEDFLSGSYQMYQDFSSASAPYSSAGTTAQASV